MNGPFPDKVTIREKYDPAMSITDVAEAEAYFKRCVEHSMRVGSLTREKAEALERVNLGYFAGYYGTETQERVQRLYEAAHPIFGPVGGPNEPKTARETFELGKRLGASPKKGDGA